MTPFGNEHITKHHNMIRSKVLRVFLFAFIVLQVATIPRTTLYDNPAVSSGELFGVGDVDNDVRSKDRTACLLSQLVLPQHKNTVLLATYEKVGTYNHTMVEKWLSLVRQFDLPVIIVALDSHTCSGLNVTCIDAAWFGLAEADLPSKPELERGYIVNVKWPMILNFLESGYNVLYSDIDIAFLRNPLNEIEGTKEFSSYDVMSQTDWMERSYLEKCKQSGLRATGQALQKISVFNNSRFVCAQHPRDFDDEGGLALWHHARRHCANTGLMFWRSNQRSQFLLRTFIAYQLNLTDVFQRPPIVGKWEQGSFNYFLDLFLSRGPSTFNLPNIQYSPLPPDKFMNTLQYCADLDSALQSVGQQLTSVHIGGEDKFAQMTRIIEKFDAKGYSVKFMHRTHKIQGECSAFDQARTIERIITHVSRIYRVSTALESSSNE